VTITAPVDGARVTGTFTVIGTSLGADSVTLRVGEAPPTRANGVQQWSVVIEEGAVPNGQHTLKAEAYGSRGTAETSVTISMQLAPTTGTQQIVYPSLVDGASLGAQLYVPPGLGSSSSGVPLVIHLHGGGGTGRLNPSILAELERRGWIGIAPDGRRWGLAQLGCSWQTSAAYVDNPDPNVGPGERDIFDAISWVQARYPVDADRIYLFGFSMGGRGTYAIGLKNPDFFAAIAPMGPAIDMFEIFVRRPDPRACKEGMMGGQPGDSPRIATMYTITSGRFLIENAYNLPVFHAHGTEDAVAYNIAGTGAFLHGWHITSDNGWNACHGGTFCFGHTPTLAELRLRHPDGYDWARMFTPVSHVTDNAWIPQIMDFFASRTRVRAPQAIVYKTYTDSHTSAYWLRLDPARPWENVPAGVRARRDQGANELTLELSRARQIAVDASRAGLSLDRVLRIVLDRLNEPAYDSGLAMVAGDQLRPSVVIHGDFSGVTAVTVTRDSTELPPQDVQLQPNRLTIGPLTVSGRSLLEIRVQQ
jgi:poly(3-hydroxybutyrate) depolymerase